MPTDEQASVKDTLKRALENYRGDDLYRARAAFRGRTPEQMQEQYGQSGRTFAEILRGYEAHDANVAKALAFVESLP